MTLVPADRLQGDKRSPLKKRKHHPYEEHVKIRKLHPYEEWVKMRQKIEKADFRKETETNAFVDFLRQVVPTSSQPASKSSPPPPQKTRRGKQTDVKSASVTTSPERVDNDDDNFVEDEVRAYGRKNIGPVPNP